MLVPQLRHHLSSQGDVSTRTPSLLRKVRASAASRFPIHFLSRHLSIPFFLSRHLSSQAAVSTGTPSLLRKVRASAASRTPITNSCTASQMHRITKRITKRSKDPGPTAGAGATTVTQDPQQEQEQQNLRRRIESMNESQNAARTQDPQQEQEQ